MDDRPAGAGKVPQRQEMKEDRKDKSHIEEQNAAGAEQPQVQEEISDFMKEEIRQRPVNRRRLARRTLITAIMAAVFGVVACVVFILLEPVINSALNPTEEPEDVSFVEETVVEEEMSPEDMVADDQEFQTAAAEEIAASSVESITQEVLEEVQKQLEEDSSASEESSTASVYESIMDALSGTMERAQRSMVTVTAITSDYDWVGDAFNETDSVSGLIIADRGTDLLILADNDGLEDAGELRITFHDEQTASAEMVCADPVTGLAVLSVDADELAAPLDENEDIAVCELGSSARSDITGTMVIAAGSPTGTQGSVNYGIITNANIALDIVDGAFQQITTNIYGSTQASGALFDDSGEVVGWIDMDHNSSDSPNLISAIGISELKGLIENMSNEVNMGYLGIHAADVPESVRTEYDMPEGVYILRTELDSPAMEAGIQAGDVIVAMGGNAVTSCEDVSEILGSTAAGRSLSVTVMRPLQDGYEEVILAARLTARFEFEE